MFKIILFYFIFNLLFLLCLGDCNYANYIQSSTSKIDKHESVTPAGGDYCINLAIRYQKANDVVSTFYYQNNEVETKDYLSTTKILNDTIKSQIKIDCKNALTVDKSGSTLSYSYQCCPNYDNQRGIRCDSPPTPYLTGGHQGNGDPSSSTPKSNNNNNNNNHNGGSGSQNSISCFILFLTTMLFYTTNKFL